MDLPPELSQPGCVARLKRSLYGLRDAPQIWKKHLVNTLRANGFEESPTMPGMLKHSARGVMVGVHVDDVIATGHRHQLKWLETCMRHVYEHKTRHIGPDDDDTGVYLGRTIKWTDAGIEWHSNPEHVMKVVREMGLSDANPVSLPMTSAIVQAETGDKMQPNEASNFRSLAARLNFAAQDRPDLALASTVAASRMSSPCVGDDNVLKRIGRYIRKSSNVHSVFLWDDNVPELKLWTDSDWATDVTTRKSRSGGVIKMGVNTIGHWTRTQDRVARSSGEAELKASCTGIAELLGMHALSAFLRSDREWPLTHCIDASATVGMLQRQGSGQLKHLDVRSLWVQEAIAEHDIKICKIPRAQNMADALASVPRTETTFDQAMWDMNLRWTLANV